MGPYPPLRLYRIPFSTNVERVALALAYKGIGVEYVEVDPDDHSEVVHHEILRDAQHLDGRFPRLEGWIRRIDALPRA